jgi:hypothetical protein
MVKFNEFQANIKTKPYMQNYQDFHTKIKEMLKEIKDDQIEIIDSNNYKNLKSSYIPINTYFFRRQKDDKWVKDSPIWFDYTGRISDNNPNQNSILINNFYYSHNNLFKPEMDGEVIAVYKVIQPLKIIHFPFTTNFNSPDLNITAAHASSFLSHLYINAYSLQNEQPFPDFMGYTADFLTFKDFNNSLHDYGTFYPGYRQLFIPAQYNNADYLEKIDDMTEI